MKHSLFLFLAAVSTAVFAATDRHVYPTPDGELAGPDGKLVFLISTTVTWSSLQEWFRHSHQFKGKFIEQYPWLYGQQVCMDMFEKCGFNALNFREHGNLSWRALAPDYKGYDAKDPFDDYMAMTKKYKLENMREMKTRRDYEEFNKLVASAKDVPVYLDFHGGYVSRLSQNRTAVTGFLDPEKVFASPPDTHPGFAIRYQLSSKAGREALLKLFRHEAESFLAKGIRPFAYKLFNEADFRDYSPAAQWKFRMAMKKKYGSIKKLNETWHTSFPSFEKIDLKHGGKAGQIEYAKYTENQVADFYAEARSMLRKLDPGALTFGQVHGHAYTAAWNNFNLYKIYRKMDFVSTGTGNFTFSQGEQFDPAKPFHAAFSPNQELRSFLGRAAFTRAIADHKPILTTEAYFDGMGKRYEEFKKVFWHEMIQGSSMVNMWQWGCYFAPWVKPTVTYGLRHPLCVSPDTWRALPEVRREIATVSDFFQIRKNRPAAEAAVLFSYPTLRANNTLMDGYLQGITALTFLQIPADAILEEQLPEKRLERYKILLALNVRNIYPETADAIRDFVRNGGTLIIDSAAMESDEYDFPLKKHLIPLMWKPLSGELVRDPETGISFRNTMEMNLEGNAWTVLSRFGGKPQVASLRYGKGTIVAIAGTYTDYGIAERIRPILEKAEIKPSVVLRQMEKEERPSGIAVHKAVHDGMTAWAFVNFNEQPMLIRASAPEFRSTRLVNPVKKENYPISGDTAILLLPPRNLLIAVSGTAEKLSRRYDTFPAVTPELAERKWKQQTAAQRKEKGYIRPSKPVDLTVFANYGYDNQQGWKNDTAWFDSKGKYLLGVPWHGNVFHNIQFDLIRFDYNRNRTCIALHSKHLPGAPSATREIPLSGQFRGVAFLHAVTHGKPGETALKYCFTYEDGSTHTVPIVVGKEIGDWRIRSNPAELQKQTAWQNYGNGFFLYEWNNPEPSKKLKSLRIESGCGESVPIIVGISTLPTKFTETRPNRIVMHDLFQSSCPNKKLGWDNQRHLHYGGPQAVCLKLKDGKSLRFTETQLKQARIRFQLKHGVDQWGKQYPKRGYVWITLHGRKDGRPLSSVMHGSNQVAEIFASQVAETENPADWNEIELPLARLANLLPNGGTVITDITGLSFNISGTTHIIKDLRIEY